jgi:aspartate racemase
LGRRDNQVKIRGHRIELGEIEAALRQAPGVRDSVVVLRNVGNEELRLIAYVAGPKLELATADELREDLQQKLPDIMIPSLFVSLEQLPLTPNGKVDRHALPDPEEQVNGSATQFVAPRTEVERQLSEIFERVLGVRPISVTDSFFRLGGHSLLAIRLFSEIERVLGRNLPLATIFRAPTIEQLARVLSHEGSRPSWSPLVGIQTQGTLPPLFCVHSLAPELLMYRDLAELLGSDQPFYGLQPRGLDGAQEPHHRIEDMAADYIREIRNIQPEGPYYLGGVCLGGIIAFEMAQQLRAQDQQVGLVALIDSHFPVEPKHAPKRMLQPMLMWLDLRLGVMLLRSPRERLQHLLERVWTRIRNLKEAARAINPNEGQQSSMTLAVRRVRTANASAERAYVPKSYLGRLVLFWCSEWGFRAWQDRRLAWSAVAEQGLEVHVTPGDHSSMMEPPHVTTLARELRTCLDRSRRSFEPSANSS